MKYYGLSITRYKNTRYGNIGLNTYDISICSCFIILGYPIGFHYDILYKNRKEKKKGQGNDFRVVKVIYKNGKHGDITQLSNCKTV